MKLFDNIYVLMIIFSILLTIPLMIITSTLGTLLDDPEAIGHWLGRVLDGMNLNR